MRRKSFKTSTGKTKFQHRNNIRDYLMKMLQINKRLCTRRDGRVVSITELGTIGRKVVGSNPRVARIDGHDVICKY